MVFDRIHVASTDGLFGNLRCFLSLNQQVEATFAVVHKHQVSQTIVIQVARQHIAGTLGKLEDFDRTKPVVLR